MLAWLNLLARPVEAVVGSLYPAYKSGCVLLDTEGSEPLRVWLTYWVLYSALNVFEVLCGFIVRRVPLYYVLKLALVIWLQAPKWKGCVMLHRKYVLPLLKKHQHTIDRRLEEGRQWVGEHVQSTMDRAGVASWGNAFLTSLTSRPEVHGSAQGASLPPRSSASNDGGGSASNVARSD